MRCGKSFLYGRSFHPAAIPVYGNSIGTSGCCSVFLCRCWLWVTFCTMAYNKISRALSPCSLITISTIQSHHAVSPSPYVHLKISLLPTLPNAFTNPCSLIPGIPNSILTGICGVDECARPGVTLSSVVWSSRPPVALVLVLAFRLQDCYRFSTAAWLWPVVRSLRRYCLWILPWAAVSDLHCDYWRESAHSFVSVWVVGLDSAASVHWMRQCVLNH